MNAFQWRDFAARRVLWYLFLLRAIRLEESTVYRTYETERGKRKQREIDELMYDPKWGDLSHEEQQTTLDAIEKRHEAERQKALELVRSERWSRISDTEQQELLNDLVAEFPKGG
jgi:predicted Fe-S protein YdhL (DUF1289 family)